MIEKLDAGDIILQKDIEIMENWNYGDLSNALSHKGSQLLIEALDLIEIGNDIRIVQDDTLFTYAKKIKNEEKYLNLNWDSKNIVNKIRGLTPKITPLLVLNNNLLGVVEAKKGEEVYESAQIGEVLKIDKNRGILVKCGNGTIWITKLKPEGKKVMSFMDFLNGNKISIGDLLKNKEEK